MKIAFISIASKEYISYYNILYKSLLPYGYKQILYHIGDVSESFDEKVDITSWNEFTQYNDVLTSICSLRARVVLDAFDKGYDKVVFLGAKVEFFSNPSEFLALLDTNNAVVTPHILEPIIEDDKLPSNASISFTGHISTDVVGFKKTLDTIRFLTWQDNIMRTKCTTTHQTYLDQSWLNFIPFCIDDVKILRDPAYNVAYWNYTQRGLQWKNGKWRVLSNDKNSLIPLVCFQYSGLEKGHEVDVSRHQNRLKASGNILELFLNYTKQL